MCIERRIALIASVLLLTACGGPDADVFLDEPTDDETTLEQELATKSPADRVVVWQQNIEAMKAAKVKPSLMTSAMLRYTYRPDIVVMQEAWQRVLCGDYQNPIAPTNLDVDNWKRSRTDARGLSRTCRDGRAPAVGSLLHQLGVSLWGGARNVDHRRPFSDMLGSHTATGTAIAWDKSRFVLEDDFVFDDAMVSGCSTILKAYKRIAVLLRDTRRTADPGDDKMIAVASIHYGSACKALSDEYVAEQMVSRWGNFEGRPLNLRFIGGDFNARVDETSSTYAARRRELQKGRWYSRYTTNTTWRGKKFLDPFLVRHGGAGETAALCGQWTYPNVQSCALKTTCSSTCTGWGIGGKLDRIDFLFVSDATGTLAPKRIVSAETDDRSFGYSDHKGLRVSVRH